MGFDWSLSVPDPCRPPFANGQGIVLSRTTTVGAFVAATPPLAESQRLGCRFLGTLRAMLQHSRVLVRCSICTADAGIRDWKDRTGFACSYSYDEQLMFGCIGIVDHIEYQISSPSREEALSEGQHKRSVPIVQEKFHLELNSNVPCKQCIGGG